MTSLVLAFVSGVLLREAWGRWFASPASHDRSAWLAFELAARWKQAARDAAREGKDPETMWNAVAQLTFAGSKFGKGNVPVAEDCLDDAMRSAASSGLTGLNPEGRLE